MSAIIIPAKLTKEALQYIEECSYLIWFSGDAPTDYVPDDPYDDCEYLFLETIGRRMIYCMVREFDDRLYEFNNLDQFIKGYDRRKICQT